VFKSREECGEPGYFLGREPEIIIKRRAQDAPANAHLWQIVIDGIFQINQAFAEIYSVAASLAVILWSASGLRNGGLSRGLAFYGCITSAR